MQYFESLDRWYRSGPIFGRKPAQNQNLDGSFLIYALLNKAVSRLFLIGRSATGKAPSGQPGICF